MFAAALQPPGANQLLALTAASWEPKPSARLTLSPTNTKQELCEAEGGVWAAAQEKGLPPPNCTQAAWGRDNHLGNGLGGHTHSFNWTLPAPPLGEAEATCVLRLRYNIRCAAARRDQPVY